jgi:hypothetical protein
METKYYKYGNIIRILHYDAADITKSRMTDVNMDEETILTAFDATRPFDAAFIQSFINITTQSKTGFELLTDSTLQEKATAIAQNQA